MIKKFYLKYLQTLLQMLMLMPTYWQCHEKIKSELSYKWILVVMKRFHQDVDNILFQSEWWTFICTCNKK